MDLGYSCFRRQISSLLFRLMVGAASVPTGLIVLGGSLSSLSLRHGLPPWSPPSQTSSNNRRSIILMAILKLAVLPVIGVLWTQLLTYHTPLVHPENIILRFIMILLSGGTLHLSPSSLPPWISTDFQFRRRRHK